MGRMDTWFDDKVKSLRGTSTARMGKTTLPAVVANLFFGPDKDNKALCVGL